MMWITIKLNTELPEETLVTHNEGNVWRRATSTDVGILGAVTSIEVVDGDCWARVLISGTTTVKAGENIPLEGGFFMSDDNGRAIISNSPTAGIIAPTSRGASAPLANESILVHLR